MASGTKFFFRFNSLSKDLKWVDDAEEHLDRRGLPGAVWPKETKNLAFLYMKVEMIDDVDITQ